MCMYVRHVITRRKPIAACAEIAIFLAICEEIAFLPCPNTAKIRHGHGRLEHKQLKNSLSEKGSDRTHGYDGAMSPASKC